MRKKICAVLCICLLTVSVSGCGAEESNLTEDNNTAVFVESSESEAIDAAVSGNDQTPVGEENIWQEDKHFKVVDLGEYEYYYAIYNSDGKLVKEGNAHKWAPAITYIDDNTIEIYTGAGTGVYFCTYYDILHDRFSEPYESPIAAKYNKVAYIDWRYYADRDTELVLVVKDMFEENSYYEEFYLDFSSAVSPVLDADFLDMNTLYLTYLSGDLYEERKCTLNLNDEKENYNEDKYFLKGSSNSSLYEVEYQIFEGYDTEEILVDFIFVAELENGTLYKMQIEDLSVERFPIYLYETDEKIYRLWDFGETDIVMEEDELIQNAIVVWQNQEMQDPLSEEEQGEHHYILVEGDKCESHYYQYNDRANVVGYWEAFYWEEGKGLIQYRSGFSALTDLVEMIKIE